MSQSRTYDDERSSFRCVSYHDIEAAKINLYIYPAFVILVTPLLILARRLSKQELM